MRGTCIALAMVVAACGPTTPTVTGPAPAPVASGSGSAAPGPAAPEPVRDPVRLAGGLAIKGYAVTLTLDPERTTFAGSVRIEATLDQPRRDLVLHGEDLTITRAAVMAGAYGSTLAVSDAGKGRLRFTAESELPAGPLTVSIDYTGPINGRDTRGVFRQEDRGHWYAFTQFEALAARRAFPCLDEPAVKVPWQLTLVVPAGQTAVANMPVASDTPDGANHRVAFEVTPPLPSYLVAFGVGPFEIVDAGKTRTGAPIRIIALAGRAAEAKVAVELTPRIVAWLEDWFGMPLPYPKIDALAIPITVSFGAMENAGLITYRSDILLMPDSAPESRKRRYASYAAHELSHQWFGDLVTPAWWDDLWLNESFATWLPPKLFAEVFPHWTHSTDVVEARGKSLGADSLGTARRIREPIATEDDIFSAFDGITYGKGAAVLRMFEQFSGEDGFQRGVRAYLTAHAHGNATAADFLAAVSTATGVDVTGPMSTLLDQAGAPNITASMTCDGDRAKIAIAQSRYLPMGAERPSTAPVWQLPVCVVHGAPGVKTGAAGARREVCGLLSQPTAILDGPGCAAGEWIYANAGGRGYYRTAIGDGLAALTTDGWRHLAATERLAVAQDVAAAVSAGEADIAAAFDVVPLLLAETDRAPIELAVRIVESVRRFLPVRDPAIARWIRAQFGPLAHRLGWKARPGEPIDNADLRETVVPLVAELGADPTLIRQAVATARDWRKLPEGGSRGDLMRVAGRAKPALTDGWRADFAAETGRVIHQDLAAAIGRVDDRARLDAALGLLLDPKVDAREAVIILFEALRDPVTQPWTEAWTVAHLDELIVRLPAEGAADLVVALTESCDPDQAAPMRAVADAKIVPLMGGPRAVQQAFEELAQCIARRHALEPSLAAWRKTLK